MKETSMSKKESKPKNQKVDKKELEEAVASLQMEVREDQIDQCLEMMNLFSSCGISASLIEIDEKNANGLALALTFGEFDPMKTVLVKHIVMEEAANNE